ncbi:MAG: hypothetical protein HUJ42_02140 [Malacoplasma sp.]|nr:hypothetical protein [Malacoplasma sp.]
MIKLSTNKFGAINLDEKFLKELITKIILDSIDSALFSKLYLEIKKNNLKKVEVFFKKNNSITSIEESNIHNQIQFVLTMHFGLFNSLIVFSYES